MRSSSAIAGSDGLVHTNCENPSLDPREKFSSWKLKGAVCLFGIGAGATHVLEVKAALLVGKDAELLSRLEAEGARMRSTLCRTVATGTVDEGVIYGSKVVSLAAEEAHGRGRGIASATDSDEIVAMA